MGMFDTITYNGEDYQTKDFDCVLDNYEIRDCRLFREICEAGKVFPGECVNLNVGGNVLRHVGWEDMSFDGVIRTSIAEGVTFIFTNGNLVEVKMPPPCLVRE